MKMKGNIVLAAIGVALGTMLILTQAVRSDQRQGPHRIVVRINDQAFASPEIEVIGAPAGYNIYTGEAVNNFAVEDGGLITLLGVDTEASIPDQGWRYIDPKAPDPAHAAADIVWIEHDFDFFGTGDVRVGFNSHFPGGWDTTPPSPPVPGFDLNAGPVKPYWVTVYSDDILEVQFKGPAVPGQ